MKAYILEKNGGIKNVKQVQLNDLEATGSQVLIETKAIGINPADVQVRNSDFMLNMITGGHIPEQVILGWDVAGVVKQVGENVTAFKPGDEVFGLISMPGLGSTYATQVLATEDQLVLKPENIQFSEAGATPMAALTAWQAVVTKANVKQGERVLVHAASGGVGHFAVQFAKNLGAYVIGTSSAKNEDFVRSLGVDEFLDYTKAPFEEQLGKVDVVIDTINSVEHIRRSTKVIHLGGRLVYLQPHFAEALESSLLDARIAGFGVFVSSSAENLKEITSLLASGKVKTKVTQTFTFDELAEAQNVVESGRATGKIVVITE
ncbi:hypothetical protein AM493_06575 [Flavobacterium akiainvivens]|uniref:Enoyl reductase (ER) domain-containing protein n=1 Tax=Flavobacterium akiainvivens TaxID=1202724 RepID=A0A0M9VHM9_9FLAO|nr:NADP-dependent oxidoreductase [Flavobacterium akiainvivens]KOS05740.1 hypothetical protein AM493_06575 [Flavobacterium akiainvivens]SFQ37655.1 NADPH:quinone reductase [Flavobacterium akiainvivens]